MKKRIISTLLALFIFLTLTITATATTLTSADALNILRYAAGLIELSESDLIRYDFDKNGAVNSSDALFVLRVVAGIIDEAGNEIARPRPQPTPASDFPIVITSTTIRTNDIITVYTDYAGDVTWTSSDESIAVVTSNVREDTPYWDRWGATIYIQDNPGTVTITGTRPNGQRSTHTITVISRTPNFNPKDYNWLVEAPLALPLERSPFEEGIIDPDVLANEMVRQERIVWEMVNEARINEGLHPLAWNSILASAARTHSIDQNVNSFLSHTGTDGSNPNQRVSRLGGVGRLYIGEIIAGNGVNSAVSAWMASLGHRDIMLREHHDIIGIGIDGNIVTAKLGGNPSF
jgi:hypothetical protein